MKTPRVTEPITQWREHWGLPEAPKLEELIAEAGSCDPEKRKAALETLEEMWHLQPERSAEKAPTVDLVEQLDRFPEEQRKVILENLAAIQLTAGCNGGCSFCVFGRKRGVTARYTFESWKRFSEKYGPLLSELQRSPPILYWDSDPFDYRDPEGHTYLDVYKVYVENVPGARPYTSTSIPRGSQRSFIEFCEYVVNQHIKEDAPLPVVRISVGKHNARRVEAVLRTLEEVLRSKYSYEQTGRALAKMIIIEGRSKDIGNLHPVGPLIAEADPFRDIYSPACADGVVLAPDGLRAILVGPATIYNPSGEWDIPLEPNLPPDTVPRFNYNLDYYNVPADDYTLEAITERKHFFLPEAHRATDGRPYDLTEAGFTEQDQLCFALSRSAAALNLFVRVTSGSKALRGVEKGNPYLRGAASAFGDVRRRVERQISDTQELLEREQDLPDGEREKLEYFITLAQLQLAKVALLIRLVNDGCNSTFVSSMAQVLERIGESQVPHIEEILEVVSQLNPNAENTLWEEIEAHGEDDPNRWDDAYARICDSIAERLGKFWEIKTNGEAPEPEYPKWISVLADTVLYSYIKRRKKQGRSGR